MNIRETLNIRSHFLFRISAVSSGSISYETVPDLFWFLLLVYHFAFINSVLAVALLVLVVTIFCTGPSTGFLILSFVLPSGLHI